jgi:hypothetical protein
MVVKSPIWRVAGLLGVLGPGLTVPFQSVRADADTEPRVTSDSPEYCLHLLDEVSQMVRVSPSPPPQEVTLLSTEGQRMCNHGQTRPGIMRLRRAWMLMRSFEGGH